MNQIADDVGRRRTVASAPEVSGSIKEKNVLRRLMSSSSTKSTSVAMESEKTPVKRLLSTTSASSDDAYDEDDCYSRLGDEATYAGEGRTMSEEEREYGKIPKRIYLDYLCACGVVAGVSYLLSAVLWQGLRVYTDYWLSQWTHHSNATAVDHREHRHEDEVDEREGHKILTVLYFSVYASLSVASIILSLLSNGIGQYAGAQARRTLHDNMLHNLLKCPMKFFESTPVGRIINRFSMDTGLIDKKLATSIQRLLQFLLLCFSAILVNAVVTPWFLLAAVPICATYYVVQHFYRYSSRELQRLDSITRSPIFSHFSETLGGLTTIRAFSHQQRFTDMLLRKMDTHANAFLIMNTANRWLGIALDYLGGVIVLMAIVASLVTATLLPGQVPPALVGLAVNYTLLVPIYLNWVVKFLADVEMYMNDVERVQQYATTPTEDYRTEGVSVPHSWPEKGDIVFENVSLRYDSKREPVVTNLNLHIPPGQKVRASRVPMTRDGGRLICSKVGICGRTGSGKSSLVMSLFHMVDVYEGSIEIDGIDITQVPLQVLRSRLSIIPQDVIIENLDPRLQYSDEDLWRSLEMAQLKDIVSSYQGCLDGEVREGGENLSAGERQLFCLARAILHDAACLIMDEATSSVDPGTEKALLAAAAKAFANKTVITIAVSHPRDVFCEKGWESERGHRLPTILECDRIVVLDEGRIVEDGSPAELMNKSMGVFSSMLKASNEGAFS
uniref:ABC transporter n=1 Tax=Timema tahoe TaxID=61484 RepID=A0A7R9III3_9NEOP|nr:unnamed protein product [Timema tahoe]